MVQKLKKHYPVEKRTEHFQIDLVGSDLYVLTVWDEDVQFVCNYEHILWCAKELIDSQLFPELDPSSDQLVGKDGKLDEHELANMKLDDYGR